MLNSIDLAKIIMARFASLSEDEYKQILQQKEAENTKQSTKQSVKLFKCYLEEKDLDTNFENYTLEKLGETLAKFYTEARKQNGELYKKTSLCSIRHGINRHLQTECDIDIVNDTRFKKSQIAYMAMNVELKRQGTGGVKHFPPTEQEDLVKLYQSFDIHDPVSLQEKVFVDIMLHFERRGRESLRSLQIIDFALSTDADGLRYIYMKRDEQTKNHQLDTNTADGRMYEIPDQDEKCPVNTFVRYKRLLPPGNTFLFPRVQKTPTASGHYFTAQPLGQNKLGSLMSTLSEKAGLSKRYTNHSLRATSAHILDSAQVPSRHIMTVTGHKSESSLKTYTGYTDCQTKRMMSHTISNSLGLQSGSREPSTTAVQASTSKDRSAENTVSALALGKVELESISIDNVMESLDDFDDKTVDELLKSMEMPVSNKILCENQKNESAIRE